MKINNRIIVVDAMRGFVLPIVGSILFIEHFDFLKGCFSMGWIKAANNKIEVFN